MTRLLPSLKGVQWCVGRINKITRSRVHMTRGKPVYSRSQISTHASTHHERWRAFRLYSYRYRNRTQGNLVVVVVHWLWCCYTPDSVQERERERALCVVLSLSLGRAEGDQCLGGRSYIIHPPRGVARQKILPGKNYHQCSAKRTERFVCSLLHPYLHPSLSLSLSSLLLELFLPYSSSAAPPFFFFFSFFFPSSKKIFRLEKSL